MDISNYRRSTNVEDQRASSRLEYLLNMLTATPKEAIGGLMAHPFETAADYNKRLAPPIDPQLATSALAQQAGVGTPFPPYVPTPTPYQNPFGEDPWSPVQQP